MIPKFIRNIDALGIQNRQYKVKKQTLMHITTDMAPVVTLLMDIKEELKKINRNLERIR